MVDPSAHAPSDEFAAGSAQTISGASRSSVASASADYSPHPGHHHYGSGRFDSLAAGYSLYHHHHHHHGQQPQQQQQQQPTLAALALADSRGQLDSGLGYYYQQPHRMRADLRAGQGFYSEPVSSAGSPVVSASSPDSYILRTRTAGSVDNAVVGHSTMSPGASALGVTFPATASTAKTMVDAAGQRASARSSSRLNSRDSSLLPADFGASGGDVSAHDGPYAYAGGSGHGALAHCPLTALPENDAGDGDGSGGAKNNGSHHVNDSQHPRRRHHHYHQQRMAQSSVEFAPQPSHPSTPSASAASLTAASGSFSFQNGNQRAQSHHQGSFSISSQPTATQQQLPRPALSAGSNGSRHSTAASATRDSMFLRFKEKMRYFKPRSRPQSDNLTDRRGVPVAPPVYSSQQAMVGSPPHGIHGAGPEPQLFGVPLTSAVKMAGVCVGRVAASGEACIVPTVVAVCGRHLWDRGQQTQGIFRVNGSMKRVQRLQAEFNAGPAYGRRVEWSGYTLHDAATMLRRYLTSLPESVIGSEHYSAFMDQQAEPLPDDAKARAYGALIEQRLVPESRHTLLYMLELLSVFARPDNSARTLMNAANLAAVLQPCLLVHPGHIANPQEYTRAKDVVEFLIVHAGAIYSPPGGVLDVPENGFLSAGLIAMDIGDGPSIGGDRTRAMTCDGQSIGSDCARAVANDDGRTLDTYAEDARATHQTQPNPWQPMHVHDGGAAHAHSADFGSPVQHPQQPYHPQQLHQSHHPDSMHGGDDHDAAALESGTPTASYDLVLEDDPNGALRAPHIQQHEHQQHQQYQQHNQYNQYNQYQQHQQHQQHHQHHQHDMETDLPRGASPVSSDIVAPQAVDSADSVRVAAPQPLGSVTARLIDPETAQQPRSAEMPESPVVPMRPRMSTFDSWHAGQSSLAVNSIQYEHTSTSLARAQTRVPNRSSLAEQPDSPVNVRSPTRPRRSVSFVVSSPTDGQLPPADEGEHEQESESENENADENGDIDVCGPVGVDAFMQDFMSRSSDAARARRHAGERRAGHVDVHAITSASYSAVHKPLPPIPHLAGPGFAGPPVSAPPDGAARPMSATKLRRVGPFASASTEAMSAGFPLYPRAQTVASPGEPLGGAMGRAPPPVHATATLQGSYRSSGSFAACPLPQQDQELPSKYAGPGGHHMSATQAWSGTSEPSDSGGRALWLSEDAPEDDYEFVGGRQPPCSQSRHESDSELCQFSATASAVSATAIATATDSGGTPQGVSQAHPHRHAPAVYPEAAPAVHPEAVPAHQQGGAQMVATPGGLDAVAVAQNRPKAQRSAGMVAADSSKDKASITRLKSLFRMGAAAGAGGSKDGGKARVPVPGPLTVGNARGDAAGQLPKPISSPRFNQKGFQQPGALGGLPRDAATGSTFDMASRLQVAVPASHLSIVYPDSPMSKADTLRRSSGGSHARQMSVDVAADSGRAYLVNPDENDDDVNDDDDEDGAAGRHELEGGMSDFRDADLHQVPSNTTTLRLASQPRPMQQHPRLRDPRAGMQDSYATLGGSSVSASAAGAGYMSSTTTFLTSRGAPGRDSNVPGHEGGNGSSGKQRLYAMHRLADSDTQIVHRRYSRAGGLPGGEGNGANAFVLPSIGGGSPLLPSFGFESRDLGSPPQVRPPERSREHRLAQQHAAGWDGDDGDDAAGGSACASASNSPRRSRSLRNTITSLRRRLSRSSRNSADVTPASMDEHAPTASVH
ncbi:GTPase activating protein (GAP) for Rho1p [Coemansia biformis]|uniref:GTPase activating protein (GAP) for Rho1p n=1 Tax=Coemansia biformis TaxID=1286918 RepID=A0A9W8CWZ1_9FUNG|nr:GTPase activating protein (GAP) for Rho1p [Coemansia biformis]